MGWINQERYRKSICITGILTILINLIPLNDLFADSLNTSNLSPQLVITQSDFVNATKDSVIDSYIKKSLLSEFEYRVLKLDIIFGTRINPAEIEKELMQLISNSDLLFYFSEEAALASKKAETRLRIRDEVFHVVLKKYGFEPFTMPAYYQEKIMKKLWEAHREELSSIDGWESLSLYISQKVQDLTPEEILLYQENPSAPKEHALKKKIQGLVVADLNEEGIALNQDVWQKITDSIKGRKEALLENFFSNMKKFDNELKQRLLIKFTSEDINYYFADTAGSNLEREKARTRMFSYFMQWLKELDGRIESDQSLTKLHLYNEGIYWESRYKAVLDRVVMELFDSYDLSIKKMLGRQVILGDKASVEKSVQMINASQKSLYDEIQIPWKLYKRINSSNDTFTKWVNIDDQPVINFIDNLSKIDIFVAEELYFINGGHEVLFKKLNAQTRKNEIFIFAGKSTRVEIVQSKEDYAKIIATAEKITGEDTGKIKRAMDIITHGQYAMLNNDKEKYKIYHRIRAVGDIHSSHRFAYIDERIVAEVSDSFAGRRYNASKHLSLIDQGKSILYQYDNPKVGQALIFTDKYPYIKEMPFNNDYSNIMRASVKDFVIAEFSQREMQIFLNYLRGKTIDWDLAYEVSEKVNKELEEFFYNKFGLKLDQDAWFLIAEIINECISSNQALSSSELNLIQSDHSFSPKNVVVDLNLKNFEISCWKKGELFEELKGAIAVGQSI
ncbi:MAG: hypothetical protein KJ915_07600 [Candidatus Omnitrophica bacterium]|nr:hypothetical protein [Candidatus Omnitrophota bacterium]